MSLFIYNNSGIASIDDSEFRVIGNDVYLTEEAIKKYGYKASNSFRQIGGFYRVDELECLIDGEQVAEHSINAMTNIDPEELFDFISTDFNNMVKDWATALALTGGSDDFNEALLEIVEAVVSLNSLVENNEHEGFSFDGEDSEDNELE